MSDYTVALVEGVVAHRARIDELLTTYSQGWPLDRMPAVDRAVLRLATFELLWRDDVPDAVVINEAVDAGAGPVDRRVARLRQRPAGPAARAQAHPRLSPRTEPPPRDGLDHAVDVAPQTTMGGLRCSAKQALDHRRRGRTADISAASRRRGGPRG